MGGASYVISRTAGALLVILVAATFNFVLFRAVPGDAVSNISLVPGASQQAQAALRHEFGLDKPKLEQYRLYMGELLHGNLGVSYANGQPVSDNLRTAIANTLPMVLLGTLVAALFGTVIGALGAWRRSSWSDHASVTSGLAFSAMPAQWVGLMLILIFAGTLPTSGRQDVFLAAAGGWAHIWDVIKHMILPAATLALVLFGQYVLTARSAMLDTLAEDYVLTARAKGLSDLRILRKHAIRNASLPVISLFALSLGSVVGGTILVETVFSWPGVGRAMYDAVLQRDYPMLQGTFLVLTISVVAFNYIADLLIFRLDPRVRR